MSDIIQTTIQENGIALVAMLDSENANTFHPQFIDQLMAALDHIQDIRPKVLILQGEPEIFSAGASKQNLLDLCCGKITAKDFLISERLLNLPCPVIAAMEGHGVGGGLIIGLCCDLVIAALESRYGATFMSLGFTPGMGCTTLLVEMVGPFLAAEMMFTAKTFRGRDLAQRRTNINYIVPRHEVMATAQNLASQFTDKSIESLYMLKETLVQRKKTLLVQARLQEELMHKVCFASTSTLDIVRQNYLDSSNMETT